MRAYPESVSAENKSVRDAVMIVGLNWLGDSIMAMPAIQAYRRAFPEKRLVMLTKPKLAGLWPMHTAIDETWICPENLSGIRRSSAQARARRFSSAYILPQSFRSAIVPFLAGIPARIGQSGHCRRFMLTKIISRTPDMARFHQQYEYMDVLGVAAHNNELPTLRIQSHSVEMARALLGQTKEFLIGLIPGAARGASKRWPADHFASLGRTISRKYDCTILIFGSDADRNLCEFIRGQIGENALNLAGQTSLPDFAALLALCKTVIGNDSGGVHLAAATGAAVVAIFGITDPAKTKPLGSKVIVLQDSPLRSRDVSRNSVLAAASLKKITPERAAEAVEELTVLNARTQTGASTPA